MPKNAEDYIRQAEEALSDALRCIEVMSERIQELEDEVKAKDRELDGLRDELSDLSGKGR